MVISIDHEKVMLLRKKKLKASIHLLKGQFNKL